MIFPEEFYHVEALEAKKKQKPIPKCDFKLNYDRNITDEQLAAQTVQEAGQDDEKAEENEILCNFYSEKTHFIAPFFVIDTENYRNCAPRISLESLIEHSADLDTLVLSLLSRQNNKGICIATMTNIALKKHFSLQAISDFFLKMNSIYK